MDLWQSTAGMVEICLTSADTAGALRQIEKAHIPVYSVQSGKDPLSIGFDIHRTDYKRLSALLSKRGDSVKICTYKGIYWDWMRLLQRPVLLAGLTIFLMLTAYLPTRVLFFQVEGNENIPARKILACCQEVGIGFGASRREVRSEKLKNALLEAMPELQWAGINTAGCVATISVRERSSPPQPQEASGVSSIVAALDAVVTECTVTKGSAACRIGDNVISGQVLISGFTDCGSTIRAEQAQGEVMGQTQRSFRMVSPSDRLQRTKKTGTIKKFALILGKKRINFYKGSGISHDSCVKMVTYHHLILPGGFQLPVTLVCESWEENDPVRVDTPEEEVQQWLPVHARHHLNRLMVAGSIQTERITVSHQQGYYLLDGSYTCREMIGISVQEENMTPNGEHD